MRHVGLRGLGPARLWSASSRSILLGGAASLALIPAAALAQSTVQEGPLGPAVSVNQVENQTAEPVETPAEAAGLGGGLGAGLNVGEQIPLVAPQSAPVAVPRAAPLPSTAAADDGLGPRDAYLEADTMIDDRDNHTVTARGSVEARYQGRTLRADQVVYDTQSGVVHAHGHTVLVNSDGTVEYGEDITLDDKLRSGVAEAFSARLAGNVTIVAGAAIRRSESVNEFNNAIYTPCNICNAKGKPISPSWSVQASKVIEDRDHHVVYYRNAVIRIKSVPVFYSPIFWTPDPTADRRSGFLTPRIRFTERRGLSYTQPYLWVLSPSADLTIAPQFNTEVNPLLNLEYRQRFYSGAMNIRLGFTDDRNFDSRGKFGDSTARSYILADGLFNLSDTWRWGFGLERASDPTMLQRYQIEDIYRGRGPFTQDTQRLLSQVYAARQDDQSFFQITALSFQSLRVYESNRQIISYDNTRAFPTAAPLVEARYDPSDPILGGRLRFLASGVALMRDQNLARIDATGLAQNEGIDDARGTAQLDWRSSYTFAGGMRLQPFVQGRADLYGIDNALATTDRRMTITRSFATAGADFSYPFIRQRGSSSIILEPLAQVAISPNYTNDPRVPNEDSVALEFDSTSLFSTDRFSGFDLYEGGQRVNAGGRATFNWGAGHSASVLVGRSFRNQADPAFYSGSGLEGTSSDWVTAVTLAPIRGLSLFSRSRLASDSFRVRREEAGADVNIWRISASARYLYNERDVSGAKTQSLNLGATAHITKNWGVSVASNRDLQAKLWPRTDLSVFYQDECIRVDIIATHDETLSSTIVPSNSVRLRLTLATLGGQGK